MRYIIIPLVIGLYIWWSYSAIKSGIRNYKRCKQREKEDSYFHFDAFETSNYSDNTAGYFLVTLVILSIIITYLSIVYW